MKVLYHTHIPTLPLCTDCCIIIESVGATVLTLIPYVKLTLTRYKCTTTMITEYWACVHFLSKVSKLGEA